MKKIWARFCKVSSIILSVLILSICLSITDSHLLAYASPPDKQKIDLIELLKAASNPQAAASLDLSPYKYRDPTSMPKNLAYMWPVYSFLLGEVFRLRGDAGQAQKMYQGLLEWAVAGSQPNDQDGSGLAGLALWRLLQIQGTTAISLQEKEKLLKNGSNLLKNRLVRGMFLPANFLSSLPQLQEEILHGLIALAWSLGKKTEAQQFFIDYISVARNGKLNPIETKLYKEAISSGVLSDDLVSLYFGKRLEKLGDQAGASEWLNKARQSTDPQVRASASYYLADLQHRAGQKCGNPEMFELIHTAIQDSSDPDTIQKALFLRSKIFIRENCRYRDVSEFKDDLNQILTKFPQGALADDALHQLAQYNLDLYCDSGNKKDLDEGLRLYAQLHKDFKDRDDFIDSSFFRPAMALYSRGDHEQVKNAIALLQELEMERPYGPLHLAALFWLGRFNEDLGQDSKAKEYFNRIIKESPYDYYAIRARMHLHLGKSARYVLDKIDKETAADIRAKYAASKQIKASFSGNCPYHARLQEALNSGLYYQALKSHIELKSQIYPDRRLENISMAELDQAHLIPATAVLLSLRQDALAAVDWSTKISNRLEIAQALGDFKSPTWPYGDWPLVIRITGAVDKPQQIRRKIQQAPEYLGIAYPIAFEGLIIKYSRKYRLSPELLYSLIRHESAFSPVAISSSGALGLFQFIASTFNLLQRSWGVLEIKDKSGRVEFLLDPDCSIYLGARWLRKEVLPREQGNYLWAVMDHVSGPQAVRVWKQRWRKVGKAKDCEYMLDTARYAETRAFTKRVLTTYWIVQATGIFQEQ
jgi:soluble lytic murein transglycosylase-like protein